GHGGYRRLAEEAILDAGSTATWKNEHRLPLFLTATCDFAPYDNPLQFSLGEQVLLMPKAGAIALLTTTRPVFSNSNRIMANNYLQQAFQRNAAGDYPALGTAVMNAKNQTYSTLADVANNRKFTLLGDPALTLAFPKYQVATTNVNGLPYTPGADTLSATKNMVIEGEVRDAQGQLLTNFNGTVFPSVNDQPRSTRTLANDPASVATTYPDRGNVLFRGKATVTGGKFSFRFIAPKDMQYAPGTGSISYYAHNENTDAQGLSPIASGGQANGTATDTEGPDIDIWLNDEKFVHEGITNLFPLLIVRLSDSSGINTSGWGVGHEITAVLDGRNSTTQVLNPFFETDLDNFRTGKIKVPLGSLEPGRHEITVKAWDVYNNPSEKTLVFHVTESNRLTISRVLNYPNPFTTHTTFWFEHNRPGEDLKVQVQLFTITGKKVKSIEKTINTPGNRSCDIDWNGKDDYGDRLARGIYIYRLSVQTPDGQKVLKTEKITIL
ncbi:MAG: type IX secretion system sortase PorU, partial [Dinghuibacter sp.]|nr:type IX secretion system sortase PorU [Dinghuibacter sp.]